MRRRSINETVNYRYLAEIEISKTGEIFTQVQTEILLFL